ncbi:MAG: riboflavin synthase [Firmicutes bacterium]|nr:riboflavin synthase [Bacillota bacterium]
MFTGLVEDVGRVRDVQDGEQSRRLAIEVGFAAQLQIGDSVCVGGVCLTVVAANDRWFEAELVPETLQRSTLGELTVGAAVNLERAMRANDRFGGHMVAGHVDGIGHIAAIERIDSARVIRISIDRKLGRYVVEKGSVAVDGVSLTVMGADCDSFEVSIIPHTWAVTTLASAYQGQPVNIEVDLIAKLVEHLAHPYLHMPGTSGEAR